MITRLFSYTRYILVIPVFGALIASISILVLGGVETIRTISTVLAGDAAVMASKAIVVKYIEIIDLFLIGTVFYITSLGLYELFIDENVPTPAWLHITHLDDLKSKLLSVIVVILMVVFVGQVIKWDSGWDILFLGTGIAVVALAATKFLQTKGVGHK